MSASPEALQHWTDTACNLCGCGDPVQWVYEGQIDGRWWYTDGHVMFRGAWPGEYRTAAGNPDMTALILKHDAWSPPPCTGESDGQVVTLSTGARVPAAWWPELIHGRGLTPHHAGGREPVIFRDAAGAVAALLMPLALPADQPPG